MSAARKFPSNRKSTRITRKAPSARFLLTVLTVASTRSVRFKTVLASTAGGSALLISFILASTIADTLRLLPPIRISAVPMTASLPFSLALPVRNSRPIFTCGEVLHPYGHAAACCNNDIADLVHAFNDRRSGPHRLRHCLRRNSRRDLDYCSRSPWRRRRRTGRDQMSLAGSGWT